MKQIYWLPIFAAIFAVTGAYLYKTLKWRDEIVKSRLPVDLNSPFDFLIAVPLISGLFVLREWFDEKMGPILLNRLRQLDPSNYESKKERVFKQLFHMTWYTLSTIAGFCLFRGTDMLPTLLFGGNEWKEFFSSYLQMRVPISARLFYMVQFSFHFYCLITFMIKAVKTRLPEHNEYMVHHIITIAMIVMGYLNMFYPLGIMVMFVSDVSDAHLALAKLVRDLKLLPNSIVDMIFALLVANWIYFRGIVLVYCGLVDGLIFMYKLSSLDDASIKAINPFLWLAGHTGYGKYILLGASLLALLCVLNYYWIYLMCGLAYRRMTQSDKSFTVVTPTYTDPEMENCCAHG